MKTSKSFLLPCCLFGFFFLWTILVLKVDYLPSGPNDVPVGFSFLNEYMFSRIGMNHMWYVITDWMGLIPVGIAFLFGCYGCYQLISRRSIKLVDVDIFLLGIFYIFILVFYVFFEIVVVNYRPIYIDGYLEASYPSTHVFVMISVMSSTILFLNHRKMHSTLRWILYMIIGIVMVITVIGRILSGVHWITDMIAGLILAFALVSLFHQLLNKYHKSSKTREYDRD